MDKPRETRRAALDVAGMVCDCDEGDRWKEGAPRLCYRHPQNCRAFTRSRSSPPTPS